MLRDGDGIPTGYIDIRTGEKVFYGDADAQHAYEQRMAAQAARNTSSEAVPTTQRRRLRFTLRLTRPQV